MTADLRGVRYTLGEAKRELDALHSEVAAYMDPSPYHVYTERRGNDHVVLVDTLREPTYGWSHSVGQLANNARSALDQLVFALAVANSHSPEQVRKWKTQFPIFSSRDDYVQKRGRTGQADSHRDTMLRGVRSAERRIIDDAQPYKWKGRAPSHPLATLDTVTNRHKHRELHPALGVATAFSVEVHRAGQFESGIAIEVLDGFAPVVKDKPLAKVTTYAPDELEVKVGADFVLEIGFETDHGAVSLGTWTK